MKKAIILYGPPGGGKGTQSQLLVRKFDLISFDTGSHIEFIVHDPANKKSKEIQRERTLFDNGTLNTPSWVLKMVKDNVARIADSGFGVILSGSPRTMYEAFGDEKIEGLVSFLVEKYGRENVIFFELVLPETSSVSRNSSRLICSLCGNSVLGTFYKNAKICPFCGSRLVKRTLDKPEVIKRRLEQYRERTQPIFAELRRQGFKIIKIDATPMPAKVFERISSYIRK